MSNSNLVYRPLSAEIGRVWFKYRSFSPLPLLVLILILPPEMALHGTQVSFILCGIALSEALRIWAVGHAGSVTRTRGDSVPRLVKSGPFQYVRNPLYIANIAIYTLLGFLYGFKVLSLLIFIYACVQYRFVVSYEEDLLERTFQNEYLQYKASVPRWLFLPFRWTRVESDSKFSLKEALRSERSTLFALAVVVTLAFIKNLF